MVDVGQGKRLAAEAGLSGGGRGFASELCRGFLHYRLARPATSERGAADPKGFAYCRRPLFWRDWWLVDWYTLKTILSPGSCILASCWYHFGIILASFWDHRAPLWNTWATSCCMGGACIEFSEFPARFWTLWGSLFSPLGVTISFPGVWNGGHSVFLGNLIPG